MEMTGFVMDEFAHANLPPSKVEHKTVGQICKELLHNPDHKQGIIDTQREMTKEYLPEVTKCIEAHKGWIQPFYVVVILKRERTLINVIRAYYTARQTMPTADYDQTVFKYFPATGDLKYLWTVPDIQSVDKILMDAAAGLLSNEYEQLKYFCWHFRHNTLEQTYGE